MMPGEKLQPKRQTKDFSRYPAATTKMRTRPEVPLASEAPDIKKLQGALCMRSTSSKWDMACRQAADGCQWNRGNQAFRDVPMGRSLAQRLLQINYLGASRSCPAVALDSTSCPKCQLLLAGLQVDTRRRGSSDPS